MFQLETEDMLPRIAPKPNTSVPLGISEGIARPQVPEVSILFGQERKEQQLTVVEQQQQQQTMKTQPQTYANWRKHVLPRVTFPPKLEQKRTEQTLNPSECSNITSSWRYMLETVASTTQSPIYPFRVITSSASTYSDAPFNFNSRTSNNMQHCEKMHCGVTQCQQNQNAGKPEITAPSIGSTAIIDKNRDVLTICAGTQTDTPPTNQQGVSWQNITCREEVEHLMAIVQDIRQDQLRILQICEALLMSQPMPEQRPTFRDAFTQVELNSNDDCYKIAETPQSAPINKLLNHLKTNAGGYHSPKGKPIAESTAYRSNSPQVEHDDFIYAANTNMAIVLPKPATEKSLVMSELAFKYLPKEKLTDLFHDLNIRSSFEVQQKQVLSEATTSPNNPLRNIENLERSPTDVSNASYKYLKKYRLLPEDYPPSENREKDTEQLCEGIKSPLLNVRQLPRKPEKYLPFMSSPSAARDSPHDEHMIDLENIKHQPKLL